MPILITKLKFKFISTSLISLTLLLFTINHLLFTASAETSLERAQSDYTFQYTKYRDAQERYQIAKSQFETFKTAVAKGEAATKTKEYLAQIDNVYIAYLLLTKEHGNFIDWGREEPQKAGIFQLLESEIVFFQDHTKQIEATQTLEELIILAENTKDHIENVLLPKINKTLATYEVVETVSAYDKFVELADKIDVLVNDRIAKEPNPFLANWTSEIKDIKEKATVPLNLAKDQLSQVRTEIASQGDLETISFQAKKSKEELKKSQALFEEALRIL